MSELTPEQAARLRQIRAQQGTAAPAAAKAAPAATAAPRGALNYRAMMDTYNQLQSGRAQFLKLSKLGQGKHTFRFLMTPEMDTFYAFRMGVYVDKAGDEGKGKSFVSARTTGADEYCPFVQVSDLLRNHAKNCTQKSRKTRAERLARDLWPKREFISNVLLLRPDGTWEAHLLTYGVQVFKALVDQLSATISPDDLDGDYLGPQDNFASTKEGKNVIITTRGQGLKTEYAVTIGKPRPVTKEELAARSTLSALVVPNSEEEAKDALCALFGVEDFDEITSNIARIALPSRDDDDEPVQTEQRRRPANTDSAAAEPAPRSKPKPPPVDDEDFEEEEAPVRGNADDDEDVDISDLPPCFAHYDEPEEGYVCKRCPARTECSDVSAVGKPAAKPKPAPLPVDDEEDFTDEDE